MRTKTWFEFLKEVQNIAIEVPKNVGVDNTLYKDSKYRLCNLTLQIKDTGYILIDPDIADHIIKQYQETK
jgi:hypothetical protein